MSSMWKSEPTQRRSSRAHERSDIYEQGVNDKGLPGPKTTIANYVENKYVPVILAAPEMAKLLEASRHLLKSYEYGNSAIEPAHDMAERIEKVLKDAGIEVKF